MLSDRKVEKIYNFDIIQIHNQHRHPTEFLMRMICIQIVIGNDIRVLFLF